MIITIDGPAHSGKSSIAAAVAQRYGFYLLNTGAMYRTIAYKLQSIGVPLAAGEPDAEYLRGLIAGDTFALDGDQVYLNGTLIDPGIIFTEEIGKAASLAGEFLEVRLKLQAEQRRIAALHKNVVAEGRDQGSYVFTEAQFKFYLTADTTVQARRYAKKKNLVYSEESDEFLALVQEFRERNLRDEQRAHHPLRIPSGAVIIATDELSPAEVLAKITEVVDPCVSQTA